MRTQAEKGQVAGRRRRSLGGMIAMQVAGKRAGISSLGLMVWRRSNELHTACNFSVIHGGCFSLLMIISL